jgi:hypothetical protein
MCYWFLNNLCSFRIALMKSLVVALADVLLLLQVNGLCYRCYFNWKKANDEKLG